MADLTGFSKGVVESIGNYVYRLIDPRNGETFYVGKGTSHRVLQHGKSKRASVDDRQEDEYIPAKEARIKSIQNSGLKVIHVIHRHNIPNAAVFEVEAALIDAYPGLTNVQGGHGSHENGPKSISELNDIFALPTLSEEPVEPIVLLNINRLEDKFDRELILRQTQLAWRISQPRAGKAVYVLAVVQGVIVGVFTDCKWYDATHANFPQQLTIDTEMPARKGFIGRPADEAVWQRFVGDRGKRIVIENMKHVQNPVRYWNIS